MSTTGNVNFNVTNDAYEPATPSVGILWFEGVTKRGPVNDPKTLITTPKQFRQIYGNIDIASDFPLLCYRALSYGAILRVNRVVGTGSAIASSANVVNGIIPLFKIYGKNAGADYNNVKVKITAASNLNSAYFNLVVYLINDPLVIETYENLTITGHPTVAASTYLDDVNKNSDLISIQYLDLSAQVGNLRPDNNAAIDLTGGSDGAAPAVTNYVGDAATGTGFHAFDGYADSYALACPELSESDMAGLSTGGDAYATLRKDVRFYQHLDNSNHTATALIAEKPSLDSAHITFTAGGLSITHPISALPVDISELADVLGNMAAIHKSTLKPWNAFFGPQYGVLTGVLGVTNNFGTPAQFADLDILAQHRINMVIKRAGKTMLWDDYTSQVAPSPENFSCVENLIIYLQKTLGPTLELFMGQPTDFTLLRSIYFNIQPSLKVVVDGRGISSWEWQGDQNATSFADLQVNNANDMQMGKVKANLRVVMIAPLKEINVNIILTKAGITFEVTQ